jgi:hypothetical protein
MANLRRNEHLKLLANCCNTLATTVFSLGILTPIGVKIWGNPASAIFSESEIFASCLLLAVASHLLGQWAIAGLKDIEDV